MKEARTLDEIATNHRDRREKKKLRLMANTRRDLAVELALAIHDENGQCPATELGEVGSG